MAENSIVHEIIYKGKPSKLVLDKTTLMVGPTKVWSLVDVFGCSSQKSKVFLFAAPQKKQKRDRVKRVIFEVTGGEEEAEKLVKEVMSAAYMTGEELPPPRRLWVILNPAAGKGNVRELYEKYIQPIFEGAKCIIDYVETERIGHAEEIVKEKDLQGYDAIVVCSGDGVLYELVNGIMSREDYQQCISIPLGIVPCGSGNSLALALGLNSPCDGALGVVKPRPVSVDAFSCRQVEPTKEEDEVPRFGPRRWGFVSCETCLVADIDFGSEKVRWMGDARFDVKYPVRLVVKPADLDRPTIPRDEKTLLCSRYDGELCPICDGDTPAWHEDPLGTGGEPTDVTVPEEVESDPLGEKEFGPRTNVPRAVEFKDNVPEGWAERKGPAVMLNVQSVANLDAGSKLCPRAHSNDGCADWVILGGDGTGRGKALSLLLSIEDGTYINKLETGEYGKCTAAYVELLQEEGQPVSLLGVDGERLEVRPLVLEMYRGLLTLLGSALMKKE